jgi:hypothetical protein
MYPVKTNTSRYFRVIAKRKENKKIIYTAQVGRFIWEGSKTDFYNDFNIDTDLKDIRTKDFILKQAQQ